MAEVKQLVGVRAKLFNVGRQGGDVFLRLPGLAEHLGYKKTAELMWLLPPAQARELAEGLLRQAEEADRLTGQPSPKRPN